MQSTFENLVYHNKLTIWNEKRQKKKQRCVDTISLKNKDGGFSCLNLLNHHFFFLSFFFIPRVEKMGEIQLFFGCMFAGKSEECNRQKRRHEVAQQKVITFKPCLDKRGKPGLLWTHSSEEIQDHGVHLIDEIGEIINHSANIDLFDVVQIDEAQWFSREIVGVCDHLCRRGFIVQLFCLVSTFMREAFGHCLDVIPLGATIKQLKAVCSFCYQEGATLTMRTTQEMETTVVGGSDKYKACCINCFYQNDSHSRPVQDNSKKEDETSTPPLAQKELPDAEEFPEDAISPGVYFLCALFVFFFVCLAMVIILFPWQILYYFSSISVDCLSGTFPFNMKMD